MFLFHGVYFIPLLHVRFFPLYYLYFLPLLSFFLFIHIHSLHVLGYQPLGWGHLGVIWSLVNLSSLFTTFWRCISNYVCVTYPGI